MNPLTSAELQTVLAQGGLRRADPGDGVGRVLTFVDAPQRQIVVHFGPRDFERYVRDVTDRVLSLAEVWLLVPRRGAVSRLGLIGAHEEAEAIRFGREERSTLAKFLCTRPVEVESTSADLYAISDSGTILITWDHHTAEDGLSIEMRRVADSTTLLRVLNELGAELELFGAEKEHAGT